MKLIERYPTTAMFLCFFVSSCLLAYCPPAVKIALMGVSLFCFPFVFFRVGVFLYFTVTRQLRLGTLLLCGALFFASGISLLAFDYHAARFEEQDGRTDEVTLQIEECEYSLPYAASYQAIVRESGLLPKGTRLLLDTSIIGLREGVLLHGEVSYTSLSRNSHGSFDGSRYYLPKRIMIMAEEESLEVTGSRFLWSPMRWFRRINEELDAWLNAALRYDAAGMTSAILLGNRDSLPDSVTRDFRRLGISHLLVVSGTHFTVLIAALQSAFRRTLLHRKYRAMITMGVIVFFMGLNGFTPSVTRAGIMYLIAQLGLILWRKSNTVHAFAVSGTVLILCNPFCAVDCGLLLSYAATMYCILFQLFKGNLYRRIRQKLPDKLQKSRLPRVLTGMLETVLLTSLITVGMTPLIWLYFGEVSLLSVPANLIFVPLVTVLLYLTMAYLLLFPIHLLTPVLAWIIERFCALIQVSAAAFSRLPFSLVSIRYSFSLFFLIPLTVLVFALLFSRSDRKKPLAVSAAVILFGFAGTLGVVRAADAETIFFSYLPEKKNDGFVLVSGGKAMICEISDASFGYSYRLTDELSELHCCEIEAMLLTHYHSRHVSLLSRLCEREILRTVVLPEPVDEKEYGLWMDLSETAEQYGAEVITVPAGEEYRFGDAVVTLFPRTYLSRSTHPITAEQIDMRGTRAVLLSGSFNQSVPEIAEAAEKADIVIFGGHSPVYKKTFGLSFEEEPEVMIACENAYSYMDEPLKALADASGTIRSVDEDGSGSDLTYRLVVQSSPE